MSKVIYFVPVSLIILMTLFGLSILPGSADEADIFWPSKEYVPVLAQSITFTVVATIHLPIVLSNPLPSTDPEVIIELPDGDTFNVGDEIKIFFIANDSDGVVEFIWGVFTQNQTSLFGGKKECSSRTECRLETTINTPPLSGTYIIAVEAIDTKGNTALAIKQIYVN
jgi:hypothetical protein